MENICENCFSINDGNYGSGRFCCVSCSRSFSTRNKRLEINEKVSKKLKGSKKDKSFSLSLKKSWIKRKEENKQKQKLSDEDFFIENSKATNQKVKKRLLENNLKQYKCEKCGIDSYNNESISLQLHHKNGMNKDNRIENLQFLCPNCHSQTENYAGKSLPWKVKRNF